MALVATADFPFMVIRDPAKRAKVHRCWAISSLTPS
jgi:hypothetical protein